MVTLEGTINFALCGLFLISLAALCFIAFSAVTVKYSLTFLNSETKIHIYIQVDVGKTDLITRNHSVITKGIVITRRFLLHTMVYIKLSGLAAWSENCNWYSCMPTNEIVSQFC
jgi:hypothetical protein